MCCVELEPYSAAASVLAGGGVAVVVVGLAGLSLVACSTVAEEGIDFILRGWSRDGATPVILVNTRSLCINLECSEQFSMFV